MLLALVAMAVALLALIKGLNLSDQVKRLERDRDALLLKVAELQRLADGLRTESPAGPPAQPEGRQAAAVASAEATDARTPEPGPGSPPSKPEGSSPAPPPSLTSATEAPHPGQPQPVSTPPPANREPPPPIDWESLLGVKGAAWVGGIALIASAIFFGHWTIEQGLVTPAMNLALLLSVGIGALVAAEMGVRKGHGRTANPLSGAGIVILYVAFFAGHARYEIVSMVTAFAALVLVTVTALAVAVRYDAFPAAVLGLLGGFATPIVVSAVEERPFGLFAYILLLDLGLLAVGVKRRWRSLFELGLAGTLAIQVAWLARFLSPANLVAGLVTSLLVGIFYVVLPISARQEDDRRVMRTSAIGGMAPFFFAVFLAGSPGYVERWPLLFGMIGSLDLAILTVAVRRGRVWLLLGAAVATSLAVASWAIRGLQPDRGVSLMSVTLSVIVIVSIPGLARRAALLYGALDAKGLRVVEVAGLAGWAGLALFGLIMVGHDRGTSSGPFLMIVTALAFLLIAQTAHGSRISGVLGFGSFTLAALIQLWFMRTAGESTLVPYLAVPVVLGLLLTRFASREAGEHGDKEAEVAVWIAGWIAVLGVLLALTEPSTGASGWPLFATLAALDLIVVGSVLRSNWTIGLPALLFASAFHVLLWQLAYLTPERQSTAFLSAGFFYLFFLLLPMVVPFARWREARLPWWTSALAGPAFFLPLYYVCKRAFGGAAIGLLPVALAGSTLVGVRMVSSRFVANPGDERDARLRLSTLALFTIVALWFVAVAIPLQFNRQWIALGWAVEAMALCWLFRRLPHPGLPVFASMLYVLAGLRLLFNPEVLRYQEHGKPFFNWILYTYGITAACCLVGQFLVRRATENLAMRRLADAIALNGLLLGFWLVNLEILDYFSTGPYLAVSDQSGHSVRLALSAGWGLYAMGLLLAGVAWNLRPLRYLSLAFLILTVAKVFLYDLSELGGIFRVFSFLGLALALILVSLFYQRFVFRKSR